MATTIFTLGALEACDLPGPNTPTTGFGDTDGNKTFYVTEVRNYTAPGPGCDPNTPLNSISTNLEQTFQQYGWVGYINDDLVPSCNDGSGHCVEPADIVEGGISVPSNNPVYPGLQGLDHHYADSETFSLFSGHGGQALLQFRNGTPLADGSNMCYVPFYHDLLSLGQGLGKDARVAAFAASCVGYMDDLDDLGRDFTQVLLF